MGGSPLILGGVIHSVSYDPASRITGISGTETQSYGYDALDRLTSVTTPGTTQTYSYDLNGNRLTETLGAQTTIYSYATDSNRLQSRTQGTTQTYTYDPAGNLIADGAHTYTYDARDRMLQATTGALTTSYRYNGLGQRVSKTAPGSSSVSRRFVYDEAGHLIGEYDGVGAPIQETVYLGDLPVAILSGTNGVHYLHADQIHAPRAITDTQGTLVWRWEPDPFGIGVPDQDPDGEGLSFVYNLRMPGQYFDAETGLSYNYFRDYDPRIGRYVQSDPIGLAGGLNTYAYVGNDPLRFSDPWGLVKCVYAIATHSLSCVSNDGTSVVTTQQGLHSGIGPCRDNPSCESASDLGPVPSHTYNVSATTLPGREGWWALQSKSWTPNINGLLCRFGLKRCGFNIHLGTFSRRCVTFNKEDPNAVDAYNRLNDLFSSDSPDNTLTVIPNSPSPAGR